MTGTLPHISIRRATPADAQVLGALSTRTFVETFVDGFRIPYPQEDIDGFIAGYHSAAAYEAILADPEQATWLAEDEGGSAVGYLVCARGCRLPVDSVQNDDGQLRRLYVLPSAQGTGLAHRLMGAALEWLEGDRRAVWLGVWSGNDKAQRFYARYGFEKIAEFDDPIGKTIDLEFAFRREAGPL